MDVLDLYPPDIAGTVVQVLVTVFDESTRAYSTRLAADLRAAGIRTELVLQDSKLGKQFGLADKKGVPVVAIAGPDEMAADQVKFKRLRDGEEVSVPRAEAAERVRQLL